LDAGGGTVATTTTAGDGSYSFTGLVPGDYRVEFVAPSGYSFSPADQGADDTVDSDADVTTGRSPLFTVASGGSDLTIDAGLYQDASIGDFVWVDVDADGVQDSGEPGVTGVTVNLLDAGGGTVATTTTAGDGSYSFTGLVPGDYRVEFVAPSGYSFSPLDQGADDAVDSDADVTTGRSPLFTVASGGSDLTIDAGLYRDASIGDFVWNDLDADGVQDGGEPGQAGVTVNLLDSGGSTMATTTTAGDGSYAFSVTPGGYRVEIMAPSGFARSPVDQGADDTLDSDTDAITGRTPLVVVTSGDVVADLDGGVYQGASVGDVVWDDLDADGIRDSGEPGVAGVTVNLLDAGGGSVALTVTAGDGSYSFTGVTPGDYRVEFVAPSGYSFSPVDQGADDTIDSDADGTTGRSPLFTVVSGGSDVTVDAGVFSPASAGDLVWDDLDADGVQDSGEPGLAGVTVNLLDAGGGTVASTTTAGNGSYSFTGLVPGDYRVEFVAPSGFSFSPVDQGADDTVDSDADGTTGRSPLFTVVSGGSDLTVDAGLYAPAAIGDVVWDDLDADGIQDSGEPGMAGVTVNLLDIGGSTVATTTTAGDGSYSFTTVTPDTYRVEFVAPAGYTFSPANRGGDDTVDSDPDPLTGRTAGFSITSGSTDVSRDAGVFAGALLGDLVWDDTDGDGVRDPGEPGMAGVTVNLLGIGGSTVATTTTAGDGAYSFAVVPGGYRVEFVAPAGYTFSPVDQGGDDTVDSDAASDGRTPLTVVSSGDAVTSVDAGLLESASIGDTVFFDVDGDGIQDPGEPGIVGITVELGNSDGDVLATTVTGPGGIYAFSSVAPGNVIVSAVATGLASTTSGSQSFTLNSGDAIDNADFGFRGRGSIGQTLWFDTDGDGVQDPEESGLGGVTVELVWAGPDGVLGTGDDLTFVTTTDDDGRYRFDGLPPGIYEVTIDGATLSGSRRVSASPDGGTDLSAVLSLGDGESITDADFAVTGEGVLALTGAEVRRSLGIALLLIVVGSLFLASTRYVPGPADQVARRR
jgi:protocatechuate 3,4-dioxygenase beta subunit